MKRYILISLGFFFVALGAIGATLPVLPTVPFMILALWCFAKSSEKFHNWLYHHKIFGPQLQSWDKYKVIPPTAKIAIRKNNLPFELVVTILLLQVDTQQGVLR